MFYSLKHIFHYVFPFLTSFTSNYEFNSIILKMDKSPHKKDEKIYMSIDHLKKGNYKLNILLNNKIVKTIEIIKR